MEDCKLYGNVNINKLTKNLQKDLEHRAVRHRDFPLRKLIALALTPTCHRVLSARQLVRLSQATNREILTNINKQSSPDC